MKKTIILAAMLALPTFGGQKAIIAPPPVAPTVVNPCEDSVWSWEVAGSYSWGRKPFDDSDMFRQKKVNTFGADITIVRQLPAMGWFKNHALFLRVGYNWGDRTWGLGEGLNTKFRAHNFTIMPGYRMTHKITDNLSYHVGGSVGITNRSDKLELTDSPVYDNPVYYVPEMPGRVPQNQRYEREQYGTRSYTDSTVGFAASLELGLRYAINPCWDVFCAYQVTVNTARTKFSSYGETVKTKSQFFHGVRLGFGRKF